MFTAVDEIPQFQGKKQNCHITHWIPPHKIWRAGDRRVEILTLAWTYHDIKIRNFLFARRQWLPNRREKCHSENNDHYICIMPKLRTFKTNYTDKTTAQHKLIICRISRTVSSRYIPTSKKWSSAGMALGSVCLSVCSSVCLSVGIFLSEPSVKSQKGLNLHKVIRFATYNDLKFLMHPQVKFIIRKWVGVGCLSAHTLGARRLQRVR